MELGCVRVVALRLMPDAEFDWAGEGLGMPLDAVAAVASAGSTALLSSGASIVG